MSKIRCTLLTNRRGGTGEASVQKLSESAIIIECDFALQVGEELAADLGRSHVQDESYMVPVQVRSVDPGTSATFRIYLAPQAPIPGILLSSAA